MKWMTDEDMQREALLAEQSAKQELMARRLKAAQDSRSELAGQHPLSAGAGIAQGLGSIFGAIREKQLGSQQDQNLHDYNQGMMGHYGMIGRQMEDSQNLQNGHFDVMSKILAKMAGQGQQPMQAAQEQPAQQGMPPPLQNPRPNIQPQTGPSLWGQGGMPQMPESDILKKLMGY